MSPIDVASTILTMVRDFAKAKNLNVAELLRLVEKTLASLLEMQVVAPQEVGEKVVEVNNLLHNFLTKHDAEGNGR